MVLFLFQIVVPRIYFFNNTDYYILENHISQFNKTFYQDSELPLKDSSRYLSKDILRVFHLCIDKDLKNTEKAKLPIIRQRFITVQLHKSEPWKCFFSFSPPETEEAVYLHMTQQTHHPHTIWPAPVSPPSSLPSPLPENKSRQKRRKSH